MVEAKDKRKNSPVKKIGTKEDEVHGEKVGRATQMFNASSVASMFIMQRIVTQTSVLVVVRLDILSKIVDMGMEQKRQPTS